MRNLRWQWTLANRGVITAVVDTDGQRETVSQDGRVLSEAQRGGRPEGHAVAVQAGVIAGRSERPPLDAVVTFDPAVAVCVLRVDGHEVTPTAWPTREKKIVLPPPARAWVRYVGFGVLLAGSLVFLAMRLMAPPPKPPPDRSWDGTQRAMNGLFIAHFRPELEAKLAVMPNGVSGILLEDKEKRVAIVIAAVPVEPATPHDRWSLQQRLRDEALANVPKGIARFQEAERHEETCLGEPGAVVSGPLAHKSSKRGVVWSCAFVHDGAGYLALYEVAEPVDPAMEKNARAIIDATELTHLADLGVLPDPSAMAPPKLDPSAP